MTTDDSPTPPAFAALEAWAGTGRVVRADESGLADWNLPKRHKAMLVTSGVPLLDGVVDAVSFTPQSGMYRLAAYGDDDTSIFAAQQDTGRVLELAASGDTRLVNSSVAHWLCSLHLVGARLSASTAIRCWDEDDAKEQQAIAELAELLDRIARLDPPAYGDGDGDHRTCFWPAVLDRWLY